MTKLMIQRLIIIFAIAFAVAAGVGLARSPMFKDEVEEAAPPPPPMPIK